MTVDEIERAAMHAAKINHPTPPREMLDCFLYLALYSLYSALYEGQLTREQARPVKQSLIGEYNDQKRNYDADMKLRQYYLNLWRSTNNALINYSHNRTLENADKLWATVQGLREDCKPISATA